MTLYPSAPLTGPDAWRGDDLAARPQICQERFTAEELAALDDAADRMIAQGWPRATGAVVEAPAVAALCAAFRHELLFGRGFLLLRGLPIDGDPVRVAARLWVLGRHVGEPVSQNARG